MVIHMKYLLLISLLVSNIAYSDVTISKMAGPWPIQIKICDYAAGAICSLTWRNKEFVDVKDHGRHLQSASSFDYLGELFNPTEAGSYIDGLNPSPSSSTLQAYWATSDALATQTKMAYWYPVNGYATSDHIFNKQVTIGAHGLAHVIEYLTQYNIPVGEQHVFGVFEVVTGYMPPEFSEFWTFNPETNSLLPLSDGPGEQRYPVIFSTPDEGWAMGIYSPNSPQSAWPAAGYGRWRFGDTVKWNNVYRAYNPSGSLHFRSYVIVGSLDNVRVSISQLHGILHP